MEIGIAASYRMARVATVEALPVAGVEHGHRVENVSLIRAIDAL
jgi:hypothetical protein